MDVASGARVGGGRFEVLARIGEGGAGVGDEVRDRRRDSRLAFETGALKGAAVAAMKAQRVAATEKFVRHDAPGFVY